MKRLQALDQFRGLTMIAMVLANFLAGAQVVPAWLKHAPDIGLTVIDLIAPFFIFAIGLSFRAAFQRRANTKGLSTAYQHGLQRALLLIGIGTVISASEAAFGLGNATNRWGVLEAIGFSSLVALAVVRLPTLWVFASGLGLLGVYQFLLERFWLNLVLRSSHGGQPGAMAWSAMLILAIGLADVFHHPRLPKWLLFLAGMALLAGGLLAGLFTPLSKNRVSGPYVLVSLGIAILAFLACYLSTRVLKRQPKFLELWGRNPLGLYLLHLLLLGLFALPPIPAWYATAPAWLIVLQAGLLLVTLTLAAFWMERRGMILKL